MYSGRSPNSHCLPYTLVIENKRREKKWDSLSIGVFISSPSRLHSFAHSLYLRYVCESVFFSWLLTTERAASVSVCMKGPNAKYVNIYIIGWFDIRFDNSNVFRFALMFLMVASRQKQTTDLCRLAPSKTDSPMPKRANANETKHFISPESIAHTHVTKKSEQQQQIFLKNEAREAK